MELNVRNPIHVITVIVGTLGELCSPSNAMRNPQT